MGIKSWIVKPFAKYIHRQTVSMSKSAVLDQDKWLRKLIATAKETTFGKDHHFDQINDYAEYTQQVPIRDYEGIKSYVEDIKKGKKDVLWPGRPRYFAKTSGTTSGVKYIPISNSSISSHINTARNAIMGHIAQGGQPLFDGRLIFLSGSPILEDIAGIKTGRLSGIVNHEIPSWAQSNQLPDYETNCIDEWEEKLDAIIALTKDQDMRLISGIPPWVQMYFERLLEVTGKSCVKDIFPNFSLLIYGGVNYEPYRASMEKLIGHGVTTLETYPASEGFIAFQDANTEDGLLLNTNAGMFFEFVELSEIYKPQPHRISLRDVKKDIDYALIISSNAGLWGYNIGDTVRFVSLDPYRIVVSGRIKHFISAFGEHVISKEVEETMVAAIKEFGLDIVDFTVAPQVNPSVGQPYHEWLIEFNSEPSNLSNIARFINDRVIDQNIYYKDLINGQILDTARVTSLSKGTFNRYMKSKGKLGGQNKIPRLTNDRIMAEMLITLSTEAR